MDKPPGAEGCLPLTSGCPPRRIPRPERYEVDDTPLSPPSSSYLLFDSSSVFNSHPHKYRLLINKPKNGSQETPPVSSSLENGHKPLRHRRSKSLVSLPRLEDSKNTSTSAINHDDSSDVTITPSAVPDDHLLRPKQLPLKKISDCTIPKLRTSLSTSDILFSQGNYSREKPEEGEDKVLRNFSDAVSLQEDKPVRFQIQPFEDFNDRMNSGSDTSSRGSKPSLPVSESTSAKYVVKEVQPEPRRLFGFGPLYRPLPETVLQKQETTSTITEKVKQTGLSAIGTDSIDAAGTAQRKTSVGGNNQGEISKTTKRETSMWMPFSF